MGQKEVVDLEGVPWVPWNPPFEGLPLHILSKSAQTQLRTLTSHTNHSQTSEQIAKDLTTHR